MSRGGGGRGGAAGHVESASSWFGSPMRLPPVTLPSTMSTGRRALGHASVSAVLSSGSATPDTSRRARTQRTSPVDTGPLLLSRTAQPRSSPCLSEATCVEHNARESSEIYDPDILARARSVTAACASPGRSSRPSSMQSRATRSGAAELRQPAGPRGPDQPDHAGPALVGGRHAGGRGPHRAGSTAGSPGRATSTRSRRSASSS